MSQRHEQVHIFIYNRADRTIFVCTCKNIFYYNLNILPSIYKRPHDVRHSLIISHTMNDSHKTLQTKKFILASETLD